MIKRLKALFDPQRMLTSNQQVLVTLHFDKWFLFPFMPNEQIPTVCQLTWLCVTVRISR